MNQTIQTPEPTITVIGWFGKDKEMTRSQFCEVWTDQVKETRRLSIIPEWQTKVDTMVDWVEREASAEFDRMYETQQRLKKS